MTAEVERLAWVNTGPSVVHANGDRARYLDLCFSCRYVGGNPHVADDESIEVSWFPTDDLPEMQDIFHDRVPCVLRDRAHTRFELG